MSLFLLIRNFEFLVLLILFPNTFTSLNSKWKFRSLLKVIVSSIVVLRKICPGCKGFLFLVLSDCCRFPNPEPPPSHCPYPGLLGPRSFSLSYFTDPNHVVRHFPVRLKGLFPSLRRNK